MIWNFCIKRPVFTVVMFLVVGIFGLYGYFNMPVREWPDVEFPVVNVNVVYPGAEPEVIETEVIEPLEEEMNTVEGLKNLDSTAREQVGTVTAEFELWRDIDIAAQDIRDRVSRARRELPDDIEEPMTRKLDPDAQAIMWIALTGDERWDDVRLTTYADEVLSKQLENLRGVGSVQIGGEKRYAARLKLSAEKLAARRVTVNDVVGTIRANNIDIPSGRVESDFREFLVKTKGQFSEPEPLNDLIITERNGAPVRIGDVGKATDGVENDRLTARFSGETTVGLGIVKRSGANTVALARRVKERIQELEGQFPAGLEYTIASDNSTFIQASINDLLTTIFIVTGIVTLVVLSVLRTLRGTFVVICSVPTSLLGGLAFMYMLGFSINTLTMLGLILAIGIVVDDAIVVLESCYRHIEQGSEPIPAARVGTTEVAFAAIANTLSLGAVFIPVAFTPGLIGRFFFEFGLTVAATVFASTFTALTLTPFLCSRILRPETHRGFLSRLSEGTFQAMEWLYEKVVNGAFRFRFVVVLLGVAAAVASVYFFRQLDTEFSPTSDRAEFMIQFETPEGTTLRQTNEYAKQIENLLDSTPQVEHYFMAIGLSMGGGPGKSNEGIFFVSLLPRAEREKHQSQIVQELRGKLAQIPTGQAYPLELGGAGPPEAPLQLVIQERNLDRLAKVQGEVMNWMRSQPQFTGVNSNLEMSRPEVNVDINRRKASQMGVSVADISNTLRLLLGEPDISEIEREGERYDIIPEITTKGEMVPEDLKQLYVRNKTGGLVSLNNLVNIEEGVGPSAIHHYNRVRAATVSASTPPDYTLGQALSALQDYLGKNLPRGVSHAVTGQAEDFQESFRNLSITLIYSVVFIYLVLSAQFGSFLHPFIILTTLPMALVGAFGGLYLVDMPFGIIAFIGLIMLLGMATKNAILLIDYSNVVRARGRGLIEGAREAAQVRFRPVIMTAVTTVLGMMPIALGFGAGGEARAPMGVSVACGMVAATVLTLIVIPVVYTLLTEGRIRLLGAEEGGRA